MSDLLTIEGGSVKSGDEDGTVIGLGIVFGSPAEPDQSKERDFFTENSFIQTKTSFDVPLYHNHGFPEKVQIGEATMTKSEGGWNAVAKLDLTNKVAKKVYKVMKTQPYGFSTGALSHLVVREAKENSTNFLSMWPVGELSLTPRPAERKAVVQAIKSLDGGGVEYSEAFKGNENLTELVSNATVDILNEDGSVLWTSTSGEAIPEWDTKSDKTIEIKYTSGTVQYNISTYDEEKERGAQVTVYEWGGVDEWIAHMQDVLDSAKTFLKTDDEELTLDDKVTSIVKNLLSKEKDSTEISELKTQLQDATDKLAQAEQKVSDSEADLTKAIQNIARLEILAGANETIKNLKGTK